MINRKEAPAIPSLRVPEIPGYQEWILPNGVRVYSVNSGVHEIVRVELVFDAGSRRQELPLCARFASRMLSEGTRSYSSSEIAGLTDFHGAWLSQAAYRDEAVVSATFLTKHAGKILPLLAEMLVCPLFPDKEYGVLVQKAKLSFSDDRLKVAEQAAAYFQEALFGKDHPYGQRIREEDFGKAEISDLKRFFDKWYTVVPSYVIISGKFGENFRKLLESHLGNISYRKAEQSFVYPEIQPSAESLIHVPMDNPIQTGMRMGCHVPLRSHPDFFDVFFLNTVLGGYFGSRLMKNIREDKGFTYGIHSGIITLKNAAMLVVSTEVGTRHTSRALSEIEKELKILGDQPVPMEEFALVKSYLTGTLIRLFDGPFQVAERLKTALGADVDYKAYYQSIFTRLQDLRPEDLVQTAWKYFNPEKMHVVLAGKMDEK